MSKPINPVKGNYDKVTFYINTYSDGVQRPLFLNTPPMDPEGRIHSPGKKRYNMAVGLCLDYAWIMQKCEDYVGIVLGLHGLCRNVIIIL